MPRPRFARLDPDRRREVLDAAAREFATHGYHEASINRVQAELGLSKGGFYYWFDDKEDLFLATLADRLAPLTVHLEGLLDGVATAEDFWAAVGSFVERAAVDALQDPLAMGLWKAAVVLSPQTSPAVQAWWTEGQRATRAVLERGVEVGAVRTDLDLDLLASLVFSVGEAMDRWLVARPPESFEDLAGLVPLYVGLFRRVTAP